MKNTEYIIPEKIQAELDALPPLMKNNYWSPEADKILLAVWPCKSHTKIAKIMKKHYGIRNRKACARRYIKLTQSE